MRTQVFPTQVFPTQVFPTQVFPTQVFRTPSSDDANNAERDRALTDLQGFDAAPTGPDLPGVDDPGPLAPAERDQLARDIAAIERATEVLPRRAGARCLEPVTAGQCVDDARPAAPGVAPDRRVVDFRRAGHPRRRRHHRRAGRVVIRLRAAKRSGGSRQPTSFSRRDCVRVCASVEVRAATRAAPTERRFALALRRGAPCGRPHRPSNKQAAGQITSGASRLRHRRRTASRDTRARSNARA